MVKWSDTLDTASASPDAHDTSSPVVHAISLQSGLKAIPRLVNKMCSQARPYQRGTSEYLWTLQAKRSLSTPCLSIVWISPVGGPSSSLESRGTPGQPTLQPVRLYLSQSPLEKFRTRSYRGAETGNLQGSNHVMVRAKIRIKLTTRKQHPPRSFNYLKLNNLRIFQTELLKHLNNTNINDFSGTANEYWSKLKECLHKSTTSRAY
ncbi:unnamed protein product [Dracunculus medinensis]|uniref:Uncharacterized protein n=1 Tax=Dracunculus medinensis TaxID=318479 RepID=A0A158Q424_DRAME|nr:unnamed protein product [Dracunculus medinensis]